MSPVSYVVGQWVRGEKFYGRSGLIEEIVDGPRDAIWLLGTRRLGKTSVLRQTELLTSRADPAVYFPLYWDFQGAEDQDELHDGFLDALADAEERFEKQNISVADVRQADLFGSLRKLQRCIRPRGLRLLLLCDEAEALIVLHRKHPAFLRKLRKALQGGDGLRSVLASTLRLWELADQKVDTSPFLQGFLPPLYLCNLDPDESRALIRQTNSPSGSRPPYDDEVVEKLRRCCDDHPYLLQLLCRRLLQVGDVEQAAEEVVTDPMVSQFFATDFEMLSETEQKIIKLIGRRESSTSNTIQQTFPIAEDHLRGLLNRLSSLGYIRRSEHHGYELVSFFFRRWFAERPSGANSSSGWIPLPRPERNPTTSAPARASPSSVPPVSVGGAKLVAELKELLFDKTAEGDYPALGSFDSRYELLERVGEGGSGAVYRARDQLLRVEVAVKVLHPSVAANPGALERFRKEIALCREIVHPNLLRLYHLGEFGERIYLTMQWVDGDSLAQVIEAEAPLEASRVRRIFSRLTEALGALHAGGVLHRDLKPANVLIDRQTDEPLLCDFGLARLKDLPSVTQSGVFVGTPHYAAPERIRLAKLDERADLFSLGKVVQQMLGSGADSELASLVRKCLQDDPEDRPKDTQVLLSALKRLG